MLEKFILDNLLLGQLKRATEKVYLKLLIENEHS